MPQETQQTSCFKFFFVMCFVDTATHWYGGVGTIAAGLCLLHGEKLSSVPSETLHIQITAFSPSEIHLLVIRPVVCGQLQGDMNVGPCS